MSASTRVTSERRWIDAAELFGRWRGGDPNALDELVRVTSPRLWHVVRAYGLDRHTAEDVVQTTWMALVRSRDRIDDPRSVTAWLATTARREAWRVARVRSEVAVTDEVLDARVPKTATIEDELYESIEMRRLWLAVRSLSHRCQRLLRVIAFEDHPDYRRLAAELDMPVGSVGPTRGRCLAKLRVLLDNRGDA